MDGLESFLARTEAKAIRELKSPREQGRRKRVVVVVVIVVVVVVVVVAAAASVSVYYYWIFQSAYKLALGFKGARCDVLGII